jgi:RNA polymerase sigma factor (sigma-70 family)
MAQVEGAILLRRIRKLAAQAPSHLTDSQLVQQFIAQRDEAAFAALVRRHAVMVLGVCRNILHHQQDAEDACQAAFLVLARKAQTIRKQHAVSSWIHGVAYRVASRMRAQARRRLKREKVSAAPCPTNPADDMTLRESQTILHEELHCLPEKYRAPLLLCYWEGKTRDEAAEQLGTTVDAFKKRLERARNLLGTRLARRGVVPSAGCFTTLLLSNDGALAVSGTLTTKISQTAVTFAAGNKAAVAASMATLAEGVIQTMSMTKWATMILTLVFVGAMGTGIGYQVVHSKQPDDPVIAVAAAQQQAQQPDKEKPPAVKAAEGSKTAVPVEAFERELDLSREFRIRTKRDLDNVEEKQKAVKATMRQISPLDIAGLKTRIATSQSALTGLVMQKITLESRFATINKALADKTDKAAIAMFVNLSEKLEPGKVDSVDQYVDQYVIVLKQQLEVIKHQTDVLHHHLDDDNAAAVNLDEMMNAAEALDEKCKRLRQKLERWDDRIEELELERARHAR